MSSNGTHRVEIVPSETIIDATLAIRETTVPAAADVYKRSQLLIGPGRVSFAKELGCQAHQAISLGQRSWEY